MITRQHIDYPLVVVVFFVLLLLFVLVSGGPLP